MKHHDGHTQTQKMLTEQVLNATSLIHTDPATAIDLQLKSMGIDLCLSEAKLDLKAP